LVVELVPWTTSIYTEEKKKEKEKVRVIVEFEVGSPKFMFWGLHYPLTWSNGVCSGRGGTRCYGRKKARVLDRGIEWISFWKKKDEDKRQQ
jgi:hypothetical protein